MTSAKTTPEQRVQALLAELSAARRGLLDAVQTLPPAQRDTPFLGTWSIKDLLAHLTGWDATSLQAVQQMLAGSYPTFFQYYDKDWQTYNAQLVRKHKVEPFEALLSAVEGSHRDLMMYLKSIPAELLLKAKATRPGGKRTLTARFLLAAEARDERVHAAQVEAFLQPN